MASDERTEYLLQGHRALFNQNPSKKALMEHIKLLVAELEQNKAAPQPDTVEPDLCPSCKGDRLQHYSSDPSVIGTGPCSLCGGRGYMRNALLGNLPCIHPPAKPDTIAVPRKLLQQAFWVICGGGGDLDCSVEDSLRALLDQEK